MIQKIDLKNLGRRDAFGAVSIGLEGNWPRRTGEQTTITGCRSCAARKDHAFPFSGSSFSQDRSIFRFISKSISTQSLVVSIEACPNEVSSILRSARSVSNLLKMVQEAANRISRQMRNGRRTHLCEVAKSCRQALEHARMRPPDHITIQYTLHNHPAGESAPSETDIRLTCRSAEKARILQINLVDHVIIGQSSDGRPGYFSFKEAGMI